MNNKMTSGEIAKKAGISQKAVRLYDEKGLLKPADYSEGNYRLYDNESLLVLEKIIALKQIGFSLEEIRDSLVGSKNTNILETLQEQINMMEAKRYELEKAITRMKAVIARSNGEPDWDDVAEVLKSMQQDQDRDAGHFFALDHTKGELDWYVKIYNSLNVKEGEKILDLGCGYAKAWRNNWKDIPENVNIYGYDLAGSWADDFAKFVEDNKGDLADGTSIDVFFEDVDEDSTWEHIRKDEKYSMIIAHYIYDVLKDGETFLANAAAVLADDGVMSLNAFGTVPKAHLEYWIDMFDEFGIDSTPFKEELDGYYAEKDRCLAILKKYFSKIDTVVLPSPFTFDNVEDVLKDIAPCLKGHASFLEANKSRIMKCIEDKLKEGDMIIPHDGSFWRLGK